MSLSGNKQTTHVDNDDDTSLNACYNRPTPHQITRLDFDSKGRERLTGVTGRVGYLIDQLTLHTSHGRQITFGTSTGGEPFDLGVRPGFHVVGFYGAFRDSLSMLGGYQRPMAKLSKEKGAAAMAARTATATAAAADAADCCCTAAPPAAVAPQYSSPATPPPWPLSIATVALAVGKSHPDTRPFTTSSQLAAAAPPFQQRGVRIIAVEVWHTSFVHALQVTYGVHQSVAGDDPQPVSTPVLGGNTDGCCHSRLVLAPNEFIVKARVSCGDVVDRLEVETNLGQAKQWGGAGGSLHTLVVPSNHAVVGFQGGAGGHLHNLGALVAPLNVAPPGAGLGAGGGAGALYPTNHTAPTAILAAQLLPATAADVAGAVPAAVPAAVPVPHGGGAAVGSVMTAVPVTINNGKVLTVPVTGSARKLDFYDAGDGAQSTNSSVEIQEVQ